jgi:hypothetical protein
VSQVQRPTGILHDEAGSPGGAMQRWYSYLSAAPLVKKYPHFRLKRRASRKLKNCLDNTAVQISQRL